MVPGSLGAPSCFHGSVGREWEVVEKYISGQKSYNYTKTDTLPAVVIDEKKEKAFKIGKLFKYRKHTFSWWLENEIQSSD